jgi:hypothetical protein
MRLERLREYKIDLCGAAAALLLAGAGYGIYLHKPLSDASRREPMRQRCADVYRESESLRATCATRQKELEATRARLITLAASLRSPAGTDELLSRLDHLATECGVQIGGWQPGGEDTRDQYSAHVYWIQGKASFPDLRKWLSLVENGVPLLDVTHFAIRGAGERMADGKCEFECTLRLYTGWDAAVTEVAKAGP